MELLVPATTVSGLSLRFWYGASISDFVVADPNAVLGQLAKNCQFALMSTQRDAWRMQIEFLQRELRDLNGSIFLEFNIPRMGRRIDVVVIIGPVVFAVEFKVGETTLDRAAMEQVWDYALDLKNFHKASHHVAIMPILIPTEATENPPISLHAYPDQVYSPLLIATEAFRTAVETVLNDVRGENVAADEWSTASYYPTPTIVEAARALYAHHSVDAIARFDAGAKNLNVTSRRIEELVDEARSKRRKRICFVTGVPGAGKTLVGLNVATHRRDVDAPTHAVFLSGNGPLVAVLSEALTRDEVERRKARGEKVRKKQVRESIVLPTVNTPLLKLLRSFARARASTSMIHCILLCRCVRFVRKTCLHS